MWALTFKVTCKTFEAEGMKVFCLKCLAEQCFITLNKNPGQKPGQVFVELTQIADP